MNSKLKELIEKANKDIKLIKTQKDLVEILTYANEVYRNSETTVISDKLYDELEDKLKEKNPKHPFLKKIGAPITEDKVTLPFYMGSLDKIKDDSINLDKWKAKYKDAYVISDKLDGNSGMIVYYSDGTIGLYTRGNGTEGQDISRLIKDLSLPNFTTIKENFKEAQSQLKSKTILAAFRGELIISRQNWNQISSIGANARNVVAGILHSKKPEPEIVNKVDFVIYELLYPSFEPSLSFKKISECGFKTVYNRYLTEGELNIENLSNTLLQRRNNSDYEIDGIVVYHNHAYKIVKGKNPANGFAFKSILTQEEAEVIIKDIEWNVSKDGFIKPTVIFDPINLNGVVIKRATGFNAGFIEKNNIAQGSKIIIIRSGDVIPHILRVVEPSPTAKSGLPTDIDYEWNETHVDIIVKSKLDNKEIKIKTLEHFAGKLDIKYVAHGIIVKFVEAGFDTIPKFLKIKVSDILKIEGFKKTSAEKIYQSIQETIKKLTCVDLMSASNIFGRGIGTKKLKIIADAFPEIYDMKLPNKEELENTNTIGTATAEAFLKGIPKFFELLKEIDIKCITNKPTSSEKSKSKSKSNTQYDFTNMKIIFTGFRSKELEKIIENNGGKITTSISKNTTLVVAEDINESGSKLQKARDIGIKIISKSDFIKDHKITLSE